MNAPAGGAVPRRNSQVLGDLVAYADQVLARPHVAFGHAERIAELTPEINAAVRRPAVDGARTIDASAAMLAQCLAELAADLRSVSQEKWIAIAGALLPWVARDLRKAAEAELRVSTTEQTR